MKWRGISEEEVYFVLQDPDRVEESIRGRTIVYKRSGQRNLKVIYKE